MVAGPRDLHGASGGLGEGESVFAGGGAVQAGGRRVVDQQVGCIHSRHRFAEEHGDIRERLDRGAGAGGQGSDRRSRVVDQGVVPRRAGAGIVEPIGRQSFVVDVVRRAPCDRHRAIRGLHEAEGVGRAVDHRETGRANAVHDQVRRGHARDRLIKGDGDLVQVADRTGHGVDARHDGRVGFSDDGFQGTVEAQVAAVERALEYLDGEDVGAHHEIRRRAGQIADHEGDRLHGVDRQRVDGHRITSDSGHGHAQDFDAVHPGHEAVIHQRPQAQSADLREVGHDEGFAEEDGPIDVLHPGDLRAAGQNVAIPERRRRGDELGVIEGAQTPVADGGGCLVGARTPAPACAAVKDGGALRRGGEDQGENSQEWDTAFHEVHLEMSRE